MSNFLPARPLVTLALLACGSSLAARAGDDAPLTIADLAAYRAALDPAKPGEPIPATFRDLWDRPDDFRGRRVGVGGRVERAFHQGAVGEFPALVEAWVVGPASDPICLVFPDAKGAPKPGDVVRFEGTFLRRIRYRGGDVDRLAPLIVGPDRPRVEPAAIPEPASPSSPAPMDGVFLLVIGGIVLLGLLRAHLRRPSPRAILDDPPPSFLDGRAGVDDDPGGGRAAIHPDACEAP